MYRDIINDNYHITGINIQIALRKCKELQSNGSIYHIS